MGVGNVRSDATVTGNTTSSRFQSVCTLIPSRPPRAAVSRLTCTAHTRPMSGPIAARAFAAMAAAALHRATASATHRRTARPARGHDRRLTAAARAAGAAARACQHQGAQPPAVRPASGAIPGGAQPQRAPTEHGRTRVAQPAAAQQLGEPEPTAGSPCARERIVGAQQSREQRFAGAPAVPGQRARQCSLAWEPGPA